MYTIFADDKLYRTDDMNDALEYARFCAYQGMNVEIVNEYGDEVEF